jgi:hypothetical protein
LISLAKAKRPARSATNSGFTPNRSRDSKRVRSAASQIPNAQMPLNRPTHAGPHSAYAARITSVSVDVLREWPSERNSAASSRKL